MEFLEKQFFGNTILDYLMTIIIVVIGVLVIFAVKIYILNRLQKKAKKTQTKFDDFLVNIFGKTLIPALYFGVIYLSVQHLALNESFAKVVKVAGIIIFTFLGIRLIISVITYALMHYWLEKVEDEAKARDIRTIMPIVKVLAYGIGIFFLLDNLGFKISTLIAGLGIGGVAVALAGQAILGDLFSYFAIVFDKPFEIGDFIIVDDHMGVIEHVGIKTTRIKSLGGEQIIMSNSDLTGSRVRNYKRMETRRVAFTIGVIYQTSMENLKEIPKIAKRIIEGIDDTRFDRTHFKEYGDFSLNFEIVYYIFGADYNKYMDVQQRINLELFEEFEKRGIEFAYPTQTLFLGAPGNDRTRTKHNDYAALQKP